MFSGVSSVLPGMLNSQETVNWGVFIVDAVGDKRSGDNTTVNVGTLLWIILDLGLFSTIAGVSISGFEEFYCTHKCIYGIGLINCD
jgi:hypothetical protein